MNKFNKKIIISIFIFFIILLLSISIIMANNTENKISIDKEKIYYEIKYFDSQIIYMINLLNNIENKSNFYIDWEKLEKETNNLYTYWSSVILDLSYLSIDKSNLTNFGKTLDELAVSIEYKNKNETINNLIELYDKLIRYTQAIEFENYNKILAAKYNLLCAYSVAENGNWTVVYEYILKATENIYKLVNSMEIDEYLQYNINQAYIAVKELENIIYIKDLNIFYSKYKFTLSKLESLTFK